MTIIHWLIGISCALMEKILLSEKILGCLFSMQTSEVEKNNPYFWMPDMFSTAKRCILTNIRLMENKSSFNQLFNIMYFLQKDDIMLHFTLSGSSDITGCQCLFSCLLFCLLGKCWASTNSNSRTSTTIKHNP